MRLVHPSPFEARWRSRWIWFERPAIVAETATRPVLADPGDRFGLFRKEIELAEVPETVPCRVWADGRYVLRVNGAEVARGPVRADPRQAHYDVVDLAPWLAAGENVIAITARHFGRSTSWWMPVPPSYSLGAGSVVLEALIGDDWLVTDRDWRCTPGEAWSEVPVPGDVACLPLESFDSRTDPRGWDSPGFDAGEWRPAFEIAPVHTGASGDAAVPSEPFGMLRPPVRTAFPDGTTHRADVVRTTEIADPVDPDESRNSSADPVKQVMSDEARLGTRITTTDGLVSQVSYDLGRIAAGTFELTVADAAAGTVIDIAAAEHLDAAGNLAPLGQHAGLRYICAGEAEERFESFDIIGTRHLHASIRTPGGSPSPAVALSIHDRLRLARWPPVDNGRAHATRGGMNRHGAARRQSRGGHRRSERHRQGSRARAARRRHEGRHRRHRSASAR